MPLEKPRKFLPETRLPMVFSLIRNVLDGVVHRRYTDAESSVTFLLFKGPVFLKSIMTPFGGVAFEKLNGLCHRGTAKGVAVSAV